MSEQLHCDLLVLGSGMAGLSAAAKAAEAGARVIVLEKDERIGGSAILSGGILWTIQSARKLNHHTRGRPELGELVIGGYPGALAWLRQRGVEMSRAMPVLRGRGYQIDIVSHLRGCAASVEQAGGHVALGSTARELLREQDGSIRGARVDHRDGELEIISRRTLLATGGYQCDPELRAQRIHPNARQMRLRSNLVSDGGGLKLGQAAGAALGRENPGFYGHLVTASPEWGDPRLFTTLSQYHSDRGILLNEQGLRFCDESEGDHVNTYETLIQSGARALLVWDDRIQQENVLQRFVEVAPPIDRMEVALQRGGEGIVAQTLEELAAFAAAQGFDGKQAAATVADYNRLVLEGWEQLAPPRIDHVQPIDRAPYYALIVHPAITYTYGGLAIDTQCQVLAADGRPLPGLLAAGADAGDVYGVGYAGGLAQAITTGLRAASTAGYA